MVGKTAGNVRMLCTSTRHGGARHGAVAKWQHGEVFEPAAAVPLYVRPSDAEIHFPRGIRERKISG